MGKVFISYRRKDADFAHRLAEKLQERIVGTVFIDLKISKDDFVVALESEVYECNVFVLVVTENTFDQDRIHSPEDWIRREIDLALELQKPVALALREGKTPPHPDELPENIRRIVTKQGIPFYSGNLFNECVDQLAQHCVSIANGGLSLRRVAATTTPSPGSVSQTGTGNIAHTGTGDIVKGDKIHADTYIKEQKVIDNRVQDALAQIHLLRQKEQALQQRLNYVGYQQPHSLNPKSILIYSVLGIIAMGIGFALHPIAGLLMVVGIGYWIFQGMSNHKQAQDLNQQEIAHLRHQIQQIHSEIAKFQRIADRK